MTIIPAFLEKGQVAENLLRFIYQVQTKPFVALYFELPYGLFTVMPYIVLHFLGIPHELYPVVENDAHKKPLFVIFFMNWATLIGTLYAFTIVLHPLLYAYHIFEVRSITLSQLILSTLYIYSTYYAHNILKTYPSVFDGMRDTLSTAKFALE